MYGLSKEYGVIAEGYGKKITFTKGYGKFKKKFFKIYKPSQYENMAKDIEIYLEAGWRLASKVDIKL